MTIARKILIPCIILLSSVLPVSAAEPVKIGIAAMISPQETIRYYNQLISYIGTKLGRPVEMVQKENYDEMDLLLKQGVVQAAFVCSGPYVKDKAEFGAELLVAPQSHGKPFYHAYIIVHKKSNIRTMAGLKGKRFGFTDPKSNTGTLVPSYMVARQFHTKPEKFFGEILYTRSHDKSIEAVAMKLVDGASVDSLIYDYAMKKKLQFVSSTRIIAKSPPYGIPPIVVRKDTDPELKKRLKDILLRMHTDPEGKTILDGIMVDRFIVPKDSDYNTVREMADWVAKMK